MVLGVEAYLAAQTNVFIDSVTNPVLFSKKRLRWWGRGQAHGPSAFRKGKEQPRMHMLSGSLWSSVLTFAHFAGGAAVASLLPKGQRDEWIFSTWALSWTWTLGSGKWKVKVTQGTQIILSALTSPVKCTMDCCRVAFTTLDYLPRS